MLKIKDRWRAFEMQKRTRTKNIINEYNRSFDDFVR